MTDTRTRVLAASALVAITAVTGACGTGTEDPGSIVPAGSEPGTSTAGLTSAKARTDAPTDARTDDEQAFLADLSGLGPPTKMTADTTIEVGVGICRGIADGADTETILDRIRPLTSAIAAQSAGLDTAEVGRTILDASRAHLCD